MWALGTARPAFVTKSALPAGTVWGGILTPSSRLAPTISFNWERNEELCPTSNHTAFPLSLQGEGRKNRLALWQPSVFFVVVPGCSDILDASFELECFVAKIIPQFYNDVEVNYSKINRFIPENSQEIHYLAYRLLERSHLQQTGYVKGRHSG